MCIRDRLTPASGYRTTDAEITVSGAERFETRGEQLVISGVQQRVLVSVTFASASSEGGSDGGSNGTGSSSGAGNAGGSGSSGTGGSSAGGSGTGTDGNKLSNTGTAAQLGLGLAGLAALAAGGITVFFARRTARREAALARGEQ